MTSKQANSILWISISRSRYFLIPDNQELPDGDFTVHSLVGEAKKVNPHMLAPFEISKEQAEPHIQAELDKTWQQVKNAFSTLTDFAAAAQGKAASKAQSPNSMGSSIASLLGISPEELESNPNAVKQSLNTIASSFRDIFKGAISEDPAHLEAARNRMSALRQHLKKQGVEVEADLELLPEKLRQQYLGAEAENNLQESATKLKEATEEVSQSFKNVLQTLKEGAAKVREAIDAVKRKDGE